MYYYEVAPNQIVRATSATFTYSSDQKLSIGQIVSVSVGKKSLIGVVIRQVKQPTYQTKPIIAIVEETPVPEPLITLALWLSSYYASHLAVVLQTILPRGLQTKRRSRTSAPHVSRRDRTKIVFTSDQEKALTTIDQMSPGTALLHGVTGSGKTTVYIEAAKHSLTSNHSAIILVPEIALTSQLVDEFSHHFDDIILTHSRQTEAERHAAWKEALTSVKPRIVIGPRSALFLPLHHIGLIVVDEAHEPSYKQEQSPRYSALRAASILANAHQAKLILGERHSKYFRILPC